MQQCRLIQTAELVLRCEKCGDIMNLPPNFPQELIPTLQKNCFAKPTGQMDEVTGKEKYEAPAKPCGCGGGQSAKERIAERLAKMKPRHK